MTLSVTPSEKDLKQNVILTINIPFQQLELI